MEYTLETLTQAVSQLQPGDKPLRIEGLDEGVYHSVNAIGSTLLKSFIEAPAKYKAAIEAEHEDKDHFRFGSLTHCLLLEPQYFEQKFTIKPEGIDRRTKVGKLAYAKFMEESEGKTVITSDELENASAVANSVLCSHKKFFKNGNAEVSYFKRHESGILLKARIDYEIGDLAIDFKTTKCSEPRGFTKACYNLMYYIQAALYLEVTGFGDFAFIAAEKEAPYLTTGPFLLDEETIKFGRLKMQKALDKMALCEITNEWPGYEQDQVIMVGLPGYLKDEYETLIEDNDYNNEAAQ